MDILTIGFGSIGSRHIQSLVDSVSELNRIYILELSDESYEQSIKRISLNLAKVIRIRDLSELGEKTVELCIIATTADVRYDVMMELLNTKVSVKYMLLEKVVFQSLDQFERAIMKMKAKNIATFVNFVYRYYPNMILLKEKLKEKSKRLSMQVIAGDIGLGCNAIHYMDLFEYLTNSKISEYSSLLNESPKPHKRGSRFREYTGVLNYKNSIGDNLFLYFDSSNDFAPTVKIDIETSLYLFSEGERSEYQYKVGQIPEKRKYHMTPTSQLTASIFRDMQLSKCNLPLLEETYRTHRFLFLPIFDLLQVRNTNEHLCPVT
ncbi:Gfo/Idh/MocA family oxidoreductase [Leptospira sp. FAT2]|uniref:Gfo/Idh/MocA family oxidoreductase n=1 Tax=Leptospira sanjuanensis TaxID=2879643 RepID=UPI001EE8A637|nr:Gfo/Idh/MocA family oxidoreductase [Leptospira sanjuanensis]MCG6167606.1 Gfo/Idh/MocA family oxidoreductase [Leptospira sanjuanensis]MCG6193025.1 Gfo/Idh/MocA family oxidoreductase [Leptospira sanjuanensis]